MHRTPTRPQAAKRRDWLDKLPLAKAKAQPMPPPLMSGLLTRGLTGLPAAQSLPVDPWDPRGCCGGAPRAPSFDFGKDFDAMSMSPALLAVIVGTSAITQTVDDILIWASAQKLRKNMECAGIFKTRTSCCQTHHIVHRKGYDLEAVRRAKAILDAAGIGIDDWENGVNLDCQKHNATRNPAYDAMVAGKLEALSTVNRATVTAVLREIAATLAAGGGGC